MTPPHLKNPSPVHSLDGWTALWGSAKLFLRGTGPIRIKTGLKTGAGAQAGTRTGKDRRHGQQGQASIMIGMMMVTFVLFFAFVINTGMLVNAKINLQNAADMAAYAGAATQARQLTHISYLNYEMRRQYKKFLFRYYVMGNMAQKPFPRGGGGGTGKTAPSWSPDGNKNYSVPVVCMIFNSKDNTCQLYKLPKIVIPEDSHLDAINTTLISQLKQIETIRLSGCLQIGFTNKTTLRLWLWNTDPELTSIKASAGKENAGTISTIQSMAYGLGLLPREILLKARIDTLKETINQPPATQVTLSAVQGMEKSPDPMSKERTIQAYYSALYTLGEYTFASGDIVMDELTPNALVELKTIPIKFDTFAIDYGLANGVQIDPANPPKESDCQPKVVADTIRNEFPIGVYKDPSILTYYAIRMQAKAKVLFSPFGDVTLKAYSAAQPFGSRIGPKLDKSAFVRDGVPAGDLVPGTGSDLNNDKHIPNLGIREDEFTAGAGSGWDTKEALGAFYNGFKGVDGSLGAIGPQNIRNAYDLAMAPNPIESGKYNIPTDQGDSFVRNFDTAQVLKFWAPVFSHAKSSQADSAIQSIVSGLIGEQAGKGSAALKEALSKEFSNYLAKLRDGQGEVIGGSREGFNIATIQDPIHYSGDPSRTIASAGLIETSPAKIKTSWNGVLNGNLRKEGRTGYSVKFVSFDSLVRFTNKSDGTATWTNGLNPPDDEANGDLVEIQH